MKVEVSKAQLEEQLADQVKFLKASAMSFDGGFWAEAKRLAVTVRVLVHDTDKSTSLFTHLNMKGRALYDSAVPYIIDNILSHDGLICMIMRGTDAPIPIPTFDFCEPRWIGFDDWWNGVVMADQEKNEFSRRDLVLNLANKDGGAHVDGHIDELYDKIARDPQGKWMRHEEGKLEPIPQYTLPYAMRQIAHEILKTLAPDHTDGPVVDGSFQIMGMPFLLASDTPPAPLPDLSIPNLRKDRPR